MSRKSVSNQYQRVSFLHQQQNNSSDNLQKQQQCSLCSKKYTVMAREHRCKRCFRSICLNCGTYQRYIVGYKINPKEKHKMCTLCGIDSIESENIRNKYKLKWGQDSRKGEQWFSILNKENMNKEKLIEQFHQNQKIKTEVLDTQAFKNYSKFLENNQHSIDQFWVNFIERNQSFKEQLHYICQQTQSEMKNQFNDIKMVFNAFINQNYNVGFCQEMVDISIFLLCFLSPYKVVYVLQQLYKQVIPEEIWPEKLNGKNFKGINEQLSIYFLDVTRGSYGIEINVFDKLNKYFNNYGLQFLMSLCIMTVNFTCSYYLLDVIIQSKNKFQSLTKGFISISQMNIEVIKAIDFEQEKKQAKNTQNFYQSDLQRLMLSEFIDNTSQNVLKQKMKQQFDINSLDGLKQAHIQINYQEKYQELEKNYTKLQEQNENLVSELENITLSQSQFFNSVQEDENSEINNGQEENILDSIKLTEKMEYFQREVLNLKRQNQRLNEILAKSTIRDKNNSFVNKNQVNYQHESDEREIMILKNQVKFLFEKLQLAEQQIDKNNTQYKKGFDEFNEQFNQNGYGSPLGRPSEKLQSQLRESFMGLCTSKASDDDSMGKSTFRNLMDTHELDFKILLQEKENEIIQLKYFNQQLENEIQNNSYQQQRIQGQKKQVENDIQDLQFQVRIEKDRNLKNQEQIQKLTKSNKQLQAALQGSSKISPDQKQQNEKLYQQMEDDSDSDGISDYDYYSSINMNQIPNNIQQEQLQEEEPTQKIKNLNYNFSLYEYSIQGTPQTTELSSTCIENEPDLTILDQTLNTNGQNLSFYIQNSSESQLDTPQQQENNKVQEDNINLQQQFQVNDIQQNQQEEECHKITLKYEDSSLQSQQNNNDISIQKQQSQQQSDTSEQQEYSNSQIKQFDTLTYSKVQEQQQSDIDQLQQYIEEQDQEIEELQDLNNQLQEKQREFTLQQEQDQITIEELQQAIGEYEKSLQDNELQQQSHNDVIQKLEEQIEELNSTIEQNQEKIQFYQDREISLLLKQQEQDKFIKEQQHQMTKNQEDQQDIDNNDYLQNEVQSIIQVKNITDSQIKCAYDKKNLYDKLLSCKKSNNLELQSEQENKEFTPQKSKGLQNDEQILYDAPTTVIKDFNQKDSNCDDDINNLRDSQFVNNEIIMEQEKNLVKNLRNSIAKNNNDQNQEESLSDIKKSGFNLELFGQMNQGLQQVLKSMKQSQDRQITYSQLVQNFDVDLII